MISFHKNKKAENNGTDRVAGRIASWMIKIQTSFANKMQRLFQNVSVKNLKMFLAVFCVVFGGYNVYTIYNAAVAGKAKSITKVDQIKTSKYITTDEAYRKKGNVSVSSKTYQQIIGFICYMDSLKYKNRKQYDSILHTRPGLMDSVRMLEAIYHSQQTK